MIFYFSGTGNSFFVAKNVASFQQIESHSIPKELEAERSTLNLRLNDGDLLGLVFPTHAWAPPQIVLEFIDRISINGGRPYVFSITTCGSEEGRTTRILNKALEKRDLWLDSSFSLVMPNNYLLGINVDSKEEENRKLQKADKQLIVINSNLKTRATEVYDLHEGRFPGLKSYFINPFFNRFSMNTKHFYATEKCNSCKICETICPVHSVIVDKKPSWKRECTHCLACINSCPQKAIEYGRMTIGRDRYLHPDLQKQLWL